MAEPTATGESPLANPAQIVNVTLPDGTPGRRETDTMGTFACSAWYYMRFTDPHNDKMPFNPNEVKYWLPVDTYVGDTDTAVMHLLYYALLDQSLVRFGASSLSNHLCVSEIRA